MSALSGQQLVNASRTDLLDDVLIRICNLVQLNDTQFSQAEQHYQAICEWLGQPGSDLSPFRPDLYPQGSVALRTTVKPLSGDEYDVDLVCQLNINHLSVARPVYLLDLIERRMRAGERYRNKLERKNRCLRVNYEHDFHLDILPACPDPSSGNGCLVVPDRDSASWRASNPKGYIEWFKQRSALRPAIGLRKGAMDSAAPLPQPQSVAQKSALQLSVQLLKRWRDIFFADSPDDGPVSIVLTTLLGDHYRGEQSVLLNLIASVESIFSALPTAGRLIVINPSHPQEELSERWKDPRKYQAFVNGMKALRSQLAELMEAGDMGVQSMLLQRMFGERIIKTAFAEQGKAVQAVRDAQQIGVSRTGAGLIGLSSSASHPIPKNTFYGDL